MTRGRAVGLALGLAAALGCVGSLVALADWLASVPKVDGLAVALLGAAVGAGEIVSRYRDAPGRALSCVPAWLYLLLNAVISIAALGLIYTYNVSPADSKLSIRCTRVLLAGFSAMALFRSAVFTVRLNGQDVGVGPVQFFLAVLAALDAAIDRFRGGSRAERVAEIMAGVDFTKALAALPPVFLALLQNPSQPAVDSLASALAEINDSTTSDPVKAQLLGLALMNLGGEDLLRKAVTSLGAQIT